ncbi:hypothetical protein FF38_06727 [Lucilia cuprina]|uniref:Uncharacterized protein n=1 Tax=Lucilia cuprina TaxID=7375 RepID=A0A0L0C791_LUCCU|nr:hypothetical protein FF38_06727 [Lucilia cuprina]
MSRNLYRSYKHVPGIDDSLITNKLDKENSCVGMGSSYVLKDEKETEMKIQDKNKTYVYQQRRPRPNFEVGTEVLVTTHVLSNVSKGITSKFVPKRDGPYIITKQIGSSTYEVSSPDNLTIHASTFTLYKGTNVRNNPVPVHPMKRRGRPRKAY